jgi:ElaB/YqjD/DUF883 family membrane-anchored ribosome-binding protein
MNSASIASQNIREAAKDVPEESSEVKKTTSAASDDIQADLQALRGEFARLAHQVGEILNGKGHAAWRSARAVVDEALAAAQEKGHEAAGVVGDVSNDLVETIDESLAKRPYTTLAIVAAIGFVFGATWRR